MLCLAFATLSKIGPDFIHKKVLKLKLSKNHFNKKCAPKLLFFKEKKLRKFWKMKKNLHFSWNKFHYANYCWALLSNRVDIKLSGYMQILQKKMSDSSQFIFSLTLIATELLDQIMDTLTDIMVTMEAVRIWQYFLY